MQQYRWDAQDYIRHSTGQEKWAQGLIAKLNLRGDESLLDIGCGDGRITVQLAKMLPEGKAIGVDNSGEMISLAISNYSGVKYTNLNFLMADFRVLPFREQFNVVFSNAALHWVRDHGTVLKSIHNALVPGGSILLQMGGEGNADKMFDVLNTVIMKPQWKDYFAGFEFPYGFYSVEKYEVWLRQAEFKLKRVELIPKEMLFANADGLKGWLRTTWLPYTECIPPPKRERFIENIAKAYLRDHLPYDGGVIHVGMVRLEVEAYKSLI
jgi:trans-aconitate methyltransferase